MMQPVYVWRRAADKRRADGTGSIELTAGASSDPAELVRLARRMAGKAGGRTPGLTDIREDGPLAEAIAGMRRDHARITRPTLAARAGVTEAALRGYLGVTGRTMADLLAGAPPENRPR